MGVAEALQASVPATTKAQAAAAKVFADHQTAMSDERQAPTSGVRTAEAAKAQVAADHLAANADQTTK